MTRTTVSLHESTLTKVKELSQVEHITLGEAMTELLNIGLNAKEKQLNKTKKKFSLKSYSLGTPKIPLEDKEAIYAALDEGQ